jgi:ribosomal protein L37AE/L43A
MYKLGSFQVSSQNSSERVNDCSKCGSKNTTYNHGFGYWQCQNCGKVWAYDEDDPDWDELHELARTRLENGIHIPDNSPENRY